MRLESSIDAICGLSLLFVLFSALRGFSLDTQIFPSPQNLRHFQIPVRSRFQWTNSHSLEVPLEIPIIIIFIIMAVKRKDASLNKILTRCNRIACHYNSLK